MAYQSKQELLQALKHSMRRDPQGEFLYFRGTYFLDHGEYASPNFYPRRYKDGWSLHACWFFYDGTFNAPKDGRVSDELLHEWVQAALH